MNQETSSDDININNENNLQRKSVSGLSTTPVTTSTTTIPKPVPTKQPMTWKTTSVPQESSSSQTQNQHDTDFPSTDILHQEKSALPPTASWYVFVQK